MPRGLRGDQVLRRRCSTPGGVSLARHARHRRPSLPAFGRL